MEAPGGRRILYVDPWAGVAGDMMLGALLEVGDAIGTPLEAALREVVGSLAVPGLAVNREPGREGGFACSRISVGVSKNQPRRSPGELIELIEGSAAPDRARRRSVESIVRLAEAEGALHGVPVEEVHLHELGGVDTLVDVLGVFSLVEALGIGEVASGPLPLGSGTVHTDHGAMGVPAPATLRLMSGLPVRGGGWVGETTTPTGALLVSELAGSWSPFPSMTVEGSGFGAGHKSFPEGPNLLRLVVGRSASPEWGAGTDVDRCLVLTTAVDDATPEVIAYCLERVLDAGALDSYVTPVLMKKGRPGSEVTVLGREEDELKLLSLLFSELGTMGIRRQVVERRVLRRRFVEVEVGPVAVRVKVGEIPGSGPVISPEYEDCRRAADELGLPLLEVMAEVRQEARKTLDFEAK